MLDFKPRVSVEDARKELGELSVRSCRKQGWDRFKRMYRINGVTGIAASVSWDFSAVDEAWFEFKKCKDQGKRWEIKLNYIGAENALYGTLLACKQVLGEKFTNALIAKYWKRSRAALVEEF